MNCKIFCTSKDAPEINVENTKTTMEDGVITLNMEINTLQDLAKVLNSTDNETIVSSDGKEFFVEIYDDYRE